MRNATVIPAALVCAVCLAGSGVSGQSQATRPGATRPPSASPRAAGAAVSATDREFINDLTIAGNAEVQLGQLTNDHAASEDVKAFGQMMIKDHTEAGAELKQIAMELNVQPAAQIDARHKELVDRLSKLQGAEFDREYMAAMVKGHQSVEDALRVRAGIVEETRNVTPNTPTAGDASDVRSANSSGGQTGGDSGNAGNAAAAVGTSGVADGAPALTQWAAKTLPAVQRHLQRAREIQQGLK